MKRPRARGAGGFSRPVALGEVLGRLRRTTPWGARLGRGEVWRLWEEAVGASVARVARPAEAEGERLWVEVENSAWLHELKLMELAIREKLNARLKGEPRIEKIFFRLAPPSRTTKEVHRP